MQWVSYYTKRFAFKCRTVDCIGFLHLLFSFRHQNLCYLVTKPLCMYHLFCWKSIVLMFKMKCTLARICHFSQRLSPKLHKRSNNGTTVQLLDGKILIRATFIFNNWYKTWPNQPGKGQVNECFQFQIRLTIVHPFPCSSLCLYCSAMHLNFTDNWFV